MINELSRDNPRLMELEAEYAKLNLFEQSVWKDWQGKIDIANFRGEIGYMAQMWSQTEERYQNTYDYLRPLDEGELMAQFGEDGAFGAITFTGADGGVFSRDLIDSAMEIQFLMDNRVITNWGAAGPTILDIGSGYGRFAYRLAQACFMGGFVYCADAVPLSTYLCEFYLKFRGRETDTQVIPLHKIVRYFEPPNWPIHLATNMQSFSEMPYSAVKFWLDLCVKLNISTFFLEPHSADLVHPHFVTSEPDGSNKDYYPLFAEHGYQLKVQRPKFPRELASQFIYSTDFLLFERG